MQKIFNKIVATLVIFMLTSVNLIYVSVYAMDDINQNASTNEANVEFNALIGDSYNYVANIDDGTSLSLMLKVLNTGYLKDVKVSIDGNNYSLQDMTNVAIKSIQDNAIELNQVNAGDTINLKVPVKISKDAFISPDYFDRDSTVNFTATYVNEKGNEVKVSKSVKEHLKWDSDANYAIKQYLVRYINYADNKTMISFKVTDGITDNKMPVSSKEISVVAPKLNDTNPTTAIVTGDNVSYTYENGNLTIKYTNTKNTDGNIKWDSDQTYIVNYLYDTSIATGNITQSLTAKATTITNKVVDASALNETFAVGTKIGNIIEGSIINNADISKGYMYTNLNRATDKYETPYSVTYSANVGYSDLTDAIKISENSVSLKGNKTVDVTGSILNKKVSVSASQLEKILGIDGTIKVTSADGTLIGTLNKDNLQLDVNSSKLIFETSATVAEGNLDINVQKSISSSLTYTKDEIKSLEGLITNISIEGFKDSKSISTESVEAESKLVEPKSNASIEISTKNLSTVVENKDVIMTVTLDTNTISDALYQDPSLKITLPEEVKGITISSATLLYEDELKLGTYSATGNTINLSLTGTQTKYSSQSISKGTVIRLVTNLTLDNLAPSKVGTINLNYTNASTAENNNTTTSVNIVAQSGFVMTNEITSNGTTVVAQESANVGKITAGTPESEVTIGGTIVNNLGENATGFTILGRIPFTGNKDIEGNDLGSNFDMKMSSAITLTGLDAKIYYSDSIAETIDGTTWTTDYSVTSKSYKIVANGSLDNATKLTFKYNAIVPANLGFEKNSYSTYAVIYDNNSQVGTTKNEIVAKTVGITTGTTPIVTTTLSAVHANTEEAIADGGTVQEGEYIKYKVTVNNTGKEDATNVKVTVKVPEGMSVITYNRTEVGSGYYIEDSDTKEFTKTIDLVKANSESTVEFELGVSQVISEISSGLTEEELAQKEKLVVSAQTSGDKIDTINSTFTVKNSTGTLCADLTSNIDINGDKVVQGREIVYKVLVRNANDVVKNNIVVQLHLPTGIEYVGNVEGVTYDKATNIITQNLKTIGAGAMLPVGYKTTVTENSNNPLITYATVKSDEMSTEVSSNKLTYNNVYDSGVIKATHASNISDGNLLDTDDLEFYIDIDNQTTKDASLTINDVLPKGLSLKSYKLTVDGKDTLSVKEGTVYLTPTIKSGSKARLTVDVDIDGIAKGNTVTYTLQPTIKTSAGVSIDVNSLDMKITGTGNKVEGTTTNSNGTGSNSQSSSNSQTGTIVNKSDTANGEYKITGVAWFDENADGKREDNENKLSDLVITLYNSDTGNIMKDTNGNDLVLKTGSDGKYSFTGLANGNYYVIVDFDTTTYDITTYKVTGSSDAENSDFIEAKLFNKVIAATDKLTVNGSNIYNMDLGLMNKRKFDLKLEQTISKITITNTKAKTHVYNYDKTIAKVELSSKNIEYSTVLVEYTIKVTNEGQVAGYAKSIIDYIPSGMTFNSELNNNWYVGNDGNGYNTSLANTIINPGETKEITLVLTKKMTKDNMGTTRNLAEIKTSYNEYGLEDIDSVAGNKKDGEDDMASTDAIILVGTGKETISIMGIVLGVFAIIALAVYEIKKHIINKMDSNIL